MKNFIVIILVFASLHLFAQDQELNQKINLDEVVVLGSRFAEDAMQSGKSVHILDSLELHSVAAWNVAEQLTRIPGLFLLGSQSTPGTNIGYYSRGLGSEYSMIMIDGVPLVDPSLPTSYMDIRLLNPLMINQIEVLHSGLGSLYGSGASGSVINLSTRSEKREGIHGNVLLTGGSYATVNSLVNLNYRNKDFQSKLSVNYQRSRGFSAAKSIGSQDFDMDGFDQYGINWSSQLNIRNVTSIEGGIGFQSFNNQYDLGPFNDSDEKEKSNMLRSFIRTQSRLGKLRLKSIHSFNYSKRNFEGTFGTNDYSGREFYNEVILQNDESAIKWLAGVQSRVPALDDPSSNLDWKATRVISTDIYANAFYNFKIFNLHSGVRQNLNESYGQHFVFHVNPSVSIDWDDDNIDFYAQYSTSFLAPSPSQLYSPWGSEDLQPEEGSTLELGTRINLGKFRVQYAYYNRSISNKIVYVTNPDWTGQLENLMGERNYSGQEVTLDYKSSLANFQFGFSNMNNENTDDYDTQNFIPVTLRQPSSIFQLFGQHQLGDYWFLNSRLMHISERSDIDWTDFKLVEMDPYLLWNVGGGYAKDKWDVSISFRNILNIDYMEVYGYNSARFNWLLKIGKRF